MPVAEEPKSSWADEIDDETSRAPLPASTEVVENGLKIVTEYKYNDDDKKVKIIRTYKIEKCAVSKSVAERKNWPKFGNSKNDKPGPDPATTIVSEDVSMLFLSNKEEENVKMEEDVLEKLRNNPEKGAVKCRHCSGDHWTPKCPYKDTDMSGGKAVDKKQSFLDKPSTTQGSKYVPPSMRENANKKGESMRRDDTAAIRVSNLSESTVEADLEELVRPFGQVPKLFLAKDKTTGKCKGFAYVHFRTRSDAARAIEMLNGHGYDHLILSVDWSKPQGSS